jgi:hypothetical protein
MLRDTIVAPRVSRMIEPNGMRIFGVTDPVSILA